jgi:hypothetical protein
MTWGEFKKIVDEHIEDEMPVLFIDVHGASMKLIDFEWTEDGHVSITT